MTDTNLTDKDFFISCDDIILKRLQPDDKNDIFNTINSQREYLGEWLPFVEVTKTVSDSEIFVNSIVENPDQSQAYVFTIRINDEFAGLIGLTGIDSRNKRAEIGYWLSEPFQGKGIVTKSVKCLLKFGFNELALNRIQIKTAVDNHKSARIPEKLGFVFEGIERDGELLSGNRFTDIKVFSLLRKEF